MINGLDKAELVINDMKNSLTKFGFSFEKGGAHLARTMMLDELSILLSYVNDPTAKKDEYFHAINEENCLGKRSGRTRKITTRHLADLYALDPNITLFKSLLFFWKRDQKAHPILSLLCAYSRDAVLRLSFPFISKLAFGQVITRTDLEAFIETIDPNRFSPATLKSTAQNINSTWTQSGHLIGKVKKIRTKIEPTPGSVAYMLLLGFLNGVRGQNLFATEYAKLLDSSTSRLIDLAENASRKGWITFKRVENVIEVFFPNLLTQDEMEWTRE